MEKFYTASGRIVFHDKRSSQILATRYVNDIIKASRPLFPATQAQVESFTRDGTLRPYNKEHAFKKDSCPPLISSI